MPFFIFGAGCTNSPRDDLNGTGEQHARVAVVMTGIGTLVDVAPPCVPDRRFVVRYEATIEASRLHAAQQSRVRSIGVRRDCEV